MCRYKFHLTLHTQALPVCGDCLVGSLEGRHHSHYREVRNQVIFQGMLLLPISNLYFNISVVDCLQKLSEIKSNTGTILNSLVSIRSKQPERNQGNYSHLNSLTYSEITPRQFQETALQSHPF